MKRYSMTRARHILSALLRDLNHRDSIELTRYGKPVVVLLSMRAYERLTSPKANFWDTYQAFRRSHSLPEANIEPSVFGDVRDTSPGREVRF